MRAISISFFLLLFILFTSTFAGPGFKQANAATSLDTHLENLAAQTANIKSIRSDFKQTKYISFMDETLISEGFFAYQAPDEIEWEYKKPLASGLIYKDGKARLWSGSRNTPAGAKSGSSSEESIGKIIAEQLITWTRLDVEKLKKTYNLTLVSESPLTVKVTPKSLLPNSPVHEVQVVFGKDRVNVRQITLFEEEEDYTRIDFFNFQRR